MLKRVVTLWMTLMMVSAGLAMAADERPGSMDRHMAPDDFPTNTVKILRTTNKAQTNSYVPVVFTMRNNNPFNVIRMLHRPVQEEEGLLFTFVSPEGTGGKVLYVVPKYMVASLGELVKSLDITGLTTSSGDLRIYRQLKHRRADSSDSGFVDTAASFSTGNGSALILDPENNALFWEDAPSGASALDGALTDWLDVPTAMVQMVVKIYELDSYNDATIGTDYMAWKNTMGQNLFAASAYSDYASIGRVDTTLGEPLGTGALGVPGESVQASGYNYAYRYETTSAFFDFLQTKGKARMLNQMKLAALNTYPASLSAGDQVLYYAVQSTDPSGVRNTGEVFQANGGRTVVGTVNTLENGQLVPVETGLSLSVVPTIGTEVVTMDLELNWSDYSGFDSTGFPQINPRELKTKLRAKIGEEIVIGNLQRQVKVQSTQKVPFLGSIPIVGYLFGGEKAQNKNTEMIVALQPIGIMDYSMAGGYAVNEGEQMVMDQANGDVKVELPGTTWGFDQYAIDPARNASAPTVQ